jgi:hypothetical protein
MKRILTQAATILLLLSAFCCKSQELEIISVTHFPDTTNFGTTVNTQIAFKFHPAALVAPFTVQFQYMINGVPQSAAIDSFLYPAIDTGTKLLNTTLPITDTRFRKGDNIIVIWPVCSQREHTLNFFRSGIFVEDSLQSSIGKSTNDDKLALRYEHDRKLLLLESNLPSDAALALQVFDIQGKMHISEDCRNNHQVPLSELASGIYVAQVRYKEKAWIFRVTVY